MTTNLASPASGVDPTKVLVRRTIAYFLDGLLAVGVVFGTLAALGEYSETPSDIDDNTEYCEAIDNANSFDGVCVSPPFGDRVFLLEDSDYAAASGAGLALAVLNHILLQGLAGFTFGKLLTGLRTVKVDTGRRPGIGRALVRTLAWIVDAIPGLPLVGGILALTTDGHKRVGDMIANTRVIGRKHRGAPVVTAAVAPPAGQTAWGADPTPGPPAAPAPPTSQFPAVSVPEASPAPAPAPAPAPSVFAPEQATPPPPTEVTPVATDAPDLGTEWAAAAPEPTLVESTDAESEGETGSETVAESVDVPPAIPVPGDLGDPEPDIASDAPEDDVEEPLVPEAIASTDPEPAPEPEPAQELEPEATAEAEGEGDAAVEPAAESASPTAPTPEPQWDAARNTYVLWEPVRSVWLQWDTAENRWSPIDG